MPTPAAYADVVRETVGDLGCRLILEPGRMLVGNAGVLLTRVLYVKEGSTRTFVIVDAAMNDLMRPALYAAYHAIVPVARAGRSTRRCATSTSSARSARPATPSPPTGRCRRSPPATCWRSAAPAPTARSMASTYNVRPLVPEVLVSGDRFAVIRPRMNVEELLVRERIPGWMRDDDELVLAPAGGEP